MQMERCGYRERCVYEHTFIPGGDDSRVLSYKFDGVASQEVRPTAIMSPPYKINSRGEVYVRLLIAPINREDGVWE